jgi:methionyl-tRNA formyltransferase
VRCTEWALIFWDPANIGVTVHELSHEIDGGAVAGQSRATVTPNDTVYSLNMQLTYLGTEIVVDVLRRVAAGEEVRLVEQDLSKGIVTYSKQWGSLLSRQIARLERDGTLAQMIESPSRGPQPIVTLSSTPALEHG